MIETVVVTCGEQRSALALTRSLGRAGYRVIVCSSHRSPLAASSRHATSVTRVPDSSGDPEGFVAAVARLTESSGAGMLIPMTDSACTAIIRHRDVLGAVRIPLPPSEAYLAISDKRSLFERARALGLRTPAQQLVPSAEGTAGLELDTLRFPIVLKPSRSVATTDEGRLLKVGVTHAASESQLRGLLTAYPPEAYPILLQQRVIGPGVGQFFLVDEGQPIAEFAHKRLREKPPSGGVSVYRESIPIDRALADQSMALLRSYGWQGVAMVEYKLDSTTGDAYLMEVNGRFWGSLQLAIDAGVDFPRLLVDLTSGRAVEPVRSYRTGVRSRWWWGDVDHLLLRLRRPADSLALDDSAPGRSRVVFDFVKLWRPGDRAEVLRLSDPRPFLRETANWLSRS